MKCYLHVMLFDLFYIFGSLDSVSQVLVQQIQPTLENQTPEFTLNEISAGKTTLNIVKEVI
jgi:hypothetical protein